MVKTSSMSDYRSFTITCLLLSALFIVLYLKDSKDPARPIREINKLYVDVLSNIFMSNDTNRQLENTSPSYTNMGGKGRTANVSLINKTSALSSASSNEPQTKLIPSKNQVLDFRTPKTPQYVTPTQPISIQKDYWKSYGFIYKHSKRYNTTTDVRPKYRFGALGKYNNLSEFNNMKTVPHILHQSAKNETLYLNYKEWMKSWLKFNPKWEHWFWTDKDIDHFVSTRYPDAKEFYFNYKEGVMKSDVFRYFVMHEFGGVYADCDVECLKPLDDKMAEHDCMLSLEPTLHAVFNHGFAERMISNALVGCRPRHPFFQYLIDYLTYNNRNKEPDAAIGTGPFIVCSAYDEIEKHTKENLPHLGDDEIYQPVTDPRSAPGFVNACKGLIGKFHTRKGGAKLEKACQKYIGDKIRNEPTNESYTVHHWMHSWKRNMFSVKGYFNIADIMK